jgi:hypothetical protein
MKNIDTKESTALVCIGTGSGAALISRVARPNASFVTQLIATAAMAVQTRRRRQASPAMALNGYKSVSSRHTQPSATAGIRVSRVA